MVWLIASAAFAFYVANFGSYDKTYGTLGGVVAFLVWMWITNSALLLGMELNAERERSRELEAGVPGAEREIQLDARTRAQDAADHVDRRSPGWVAWEVTDVGASRSQRPFHTGSRFSKNAVTPSTMSSVENASASCARRKSSASANAMSCWRNIASLPIRISTGDFFARLGRPVGDERVELLGRHGPVDRPIRSASAAEICSPSSSSSLVFLRPTLR